MAVPRTTGHHLPQDTTTQPLPLPTVHGVILQTLNHQYPPAVAAVAAVVGIRAPPPDPLLPLRGAISNTILGAMSLRTRRTGGEGLKMSLSTRTPWERTTVTPTRFRMI